MDDGARTLVTVRAPCMVCDTCRRCPGRLPRGCVRRPRRTGLDLAPHGTTGRRGHHRRATAGRHGPPPVTPAAARPDEAGPTDRQQGATRSDTADHDPARRGPDDRGPHRPRRPRWATAGRTWSSSSPPGGAGRDAERGAVRAVRRRPHGRRAARVLPRPRPHPPRRRRGDPLQRQGELGIWASLLGQEAAQVGSGRALKPQDYAFPTYREHGVAWCRGVDPLNLLGMFRGVNNGGWTPTRRTSTSTRSSSAPRRCTRRLRHGDPARRRRRHRRPDRDAAVIAYFGDGASSQGDVSESFGFSAVYNAPVVFFCQNNQWAISEPNEKQTRIPLYQRARGFGFPASGSTATTSSRSTP